MKTAGFLIVAALTLATLAATKKPCMKHKQGATQRWLPMSREAIATIGREPTEVRTMVDTEVSLVAVFCHV